MESVFVRINMLEHGFYNVAIFSLRGAWFLSSFIRFSFFVLRENFSTFLVSAFRGLPSSLAGWERGIPKPRHLRTTGLHAQEGRDTLEHLDGC